MIQWKYKTRLTKNAAASQMERPNGKPAVYFSCHPADLDLYLDAVADGLLRFQNFAVWYTDADIPFGEIEPFLSAMCLFVVPVTKNLLTSESRAVCEELTYAKENRIPILPLMMEPGLEQLYRDTFGNIQYISFSPKTAEDSRHLEKYLSVMFSGDEISEKIHDAFGIKVFLSYRKKDFRHVLKLERQIHQYPEFGHVEFWYDDYLTPGEDFEDSIIGAICKCDLFLLIVTPSILEQGNYVLLKEYPLAKAMGKPVLAVRMAETDKKELGRVYGENLSLVNPEKEKEFFRELFSRLEGCIQREMQNETPERKYFRGLGYYTGTLVERNPQKGLQYIQEAVGAGLPDPVNRLSQIYQYGNERDLPRAAALKKQYIEILRQNSGVADFAYAGEFLDYGKLCASPSTDDPNRSVMTDMQGAQEAFQKVVEIAARPENEKNISKWRQMLLSSYRYLAKISEIQDNKEDALRYADLRVEIAREAYANSSDINYLREMFDGLYTCIRFAHGVDEKIYYSKERCNAAEKIADISGEDDDIDRFYTSLSRIAGLYKARNDLGKEEECYHAILKLSPQAVSRKREYQRYAYLKLADLCIRKNDPYMEGHYMRLWMGEPDERRW
ncbi:MAG: toll/interleukin-1 receptor domain-containing protein [Lachnospiraceae bacterium]|nr:toll/interleukin-1 receptor domain-containing protein [Lachnospiraceae bacterium]